MVGRRGGTDCEWMLWFGHLCKVRKMVVGGGGVARKISI